VGSVSFHASRPERIEVSTRTIDRILVATDGSDSSQHAVALGVELAAAEGAEVTFLHVLPPIDFLGGRASLPAVPRRLQSVGDEPLDDAALIADRRGVRFERDLVAGYVADTIVDWADAVEADLVVVGERPRRRWVGTTVARWVARNSDRPVLVARPRAKERVAA
jgi:nucleotide-binding universal stress UspA family protein